MNISEMNLNQLEDLHRKLRTDEQHLLFRISTTNDVSKSQLTHHRQFRFHVETLISERNKERI
jgi:hypothetical protein